MLGNRLSYNNDFSSNDFVATISLFFKQRFLSNDIRDSLATISSNDSLATILSSLARISHRWQKITALLENPENHDSSVRWQKNRR